MKEQQIAIVPARGGSKGIPHKNARPLAGAPLVSHTIRAAIASGVFDAVVLSTDDEAIARIGQSEGCMVVLRPPELADDRTPTEPVMAHALAEAERLLARRFDVVWLLQPTSPLRDACDISRAAQLLESECDAVVSVTDDHSFYWTASDGGTVVPGYEPANRPRRQDMTAHFRENGAIYAVKRGTWESSGVRVAGRIAPFVMSADRSIEIDSEADWRLAEALLTTQMGGGRLAVCLPGRVEAVIFDFDGVFTDNTVIVSQTGEESVVVSRSDGWGIARLRDVGIHMVVISTEENPVVAARAGKLGIECIQGVSDKAAALEDWLERSGVHREACVFVGNDVNDLPCFPLVGAAIVPSDAYHEVLSQADGVTVAPGGRGAVREVADAILRKAG